MKRKIPIALALGFSGLFVVLFAMIGLSLGESHKQQNPSQLNLKSQTTETRAFQSQTPAKTPIPAQTKIPREVQGGTNSITSCSSPGTSTDRPNGHPPLHASGSIVKLATNSTYYLIDGGRKRAISSPTVLNNLYTNGGFGFNDAIVISADELGLYTPGSDITNTLPSNGRSQPDGRLIQASGGSEISIVTNNGGRRPFASGSRFQNLGYQFCNVVLVTPSDYNSYQPVGMAVGEYVSPSSPPNGATTQSLTPTLTWSQIALASSYKLLVAVNLNDLPISPYDNCFGCVINTSTSATSYTPSSGLLNASTKYYWQIQAVNIPDFTVWSQTWDFTTMAVPPIIRIDPNTLTFSQTASSGMAPESNRWNTKTLSPNDPNGQVYRERGRISGTKGRASKSALVNFAELAQQEATKRSTIKPEAIHPPVTGSRIPPEMEKAPDQRKPFRVNNLLSPSPAPSSSFQALYDDGSRIPPDTHGSVGPSHLMTVHNSQVRVQNRSGNAITTVSLYGFWSSLGPFSTGPFDPRILFDPYQNRWIFTSCADPRAPTSSVLIGVTQSSDPTGFWNLYRIDADAGNTLWADYPSLGFNKDWVVVRVNLVTNNDAIERANIYVFDKSDLFSGGAGRFTLFQPLTLADSEVAATYDPTLSSLYLIQSWQGNSNGNGTLRISTITGDLGFEVLNPGTAIPSTPNTWNTTPPGGPFSDFAPQLGSNQRIFTLDSRIRSVIYRNGSIWCTQTVFLPSPGVATHSSIQWWQLTGNGSIQQFGRIDDPGGNTFYAFPSLAVNRNNDVLIGYSSFSFNQYASANYSFRFASDPPSTLRSDTLLKAGEATYYKIFTASTNRWGDYSSTVVDPINDTDMWTIQEYAGSPADHWSTWWGRVSPRQSMLKLFTVYNDGGTNLTVSTVTSENSSSWISIDPATAPPFSIGSGSSANVAVIVNATGLSPGPYMDRLVVRSNDTSRDPYPNGVFINLTVAGPTAAPSSIHGRVLSNNNTPVGGTTVTLIGGRRLLRVITDDHGYYNIRDLETGGFYTLAPSRTNYLFNPSDRSFSLIAEKSDADFTALSVAPHANPLDNPEFFIRQQYLDFLGREPDQGGLDYWSGELRACDTVDRCLNSRRVGVAAAFFLENEFQQTGSLIYRIYKASLGKQPTFAEFSRDRSKLIGGATLEERQRTFAEELVQAPDFKQIYPDSMVATQFVNKLFDRAGLQPYVDERQQQVRAMSVGKTRAEVLLDLIEIPEFKTRQYNPSFIVMEYFAYLHRDPDPGGYSFWLTALNNGEPNNYRAFVCAFITSREYQERFSPVVTRANAECVR